VGTARWDEAWATGTPHGCAGPWRDNLRFWRLRRLVLWHPAWFRLPPNSVCVMV